MMNIITHRYDAESEKAMAPHSSTLAWKIPWTEEPRRLKPMGSLRVRYDWTTSLSLFHFHALEKEMATHSSVLAWRLPGTGEPGGLPSMGSHRVGHDWSDLAAAAAAAWCWIVYRSLLLQSLHSVSVGTSPLCWWESGTQIIDDNDDHNKWEVKEKTTASILSPLLCDWIGVLYILLLFSH